jgi:hypothetical protein
MDLVSAIKLAGVSLRNWRVVFGRALGHLLVHDVIIRWRVIRSARLCLFALVLNGVGKVYKKGKRWESEKILKKNRYTLFFLLLLLTGRLAAGAPSLEPESRRAGMTSGSFLTQRRRR